MFNQVMFGVISTTLKALARITQKALATLGAFVFVGVIAITGCSGAEVEPSFPPQTAFPTQTSTAAPSYSPKLDVREISIAQSDISFTVCFALPPSDKAWVLGRLPGDVFLSDGQQSVVLQSFSLVGFEEKSDSAFNTRCDQFTSSLPANFDRNQATLTVKRIAASMPQQIDWDRVLDRVEALAPGVVIEPMPDQGGPSFAVVEVPSGMTDLEAHNLVVGTIDPVIIGPWTVPIILDPQ